MRVTDQQQKTWTRQEGEITGLAHFVLYPAILALKMWRGICAVVGMALLCGVYSFYLHLGWIVGLGPNSYAYRMQFVEKAMRYPSDVEMNFSARPVLTEARKEELKQYPNLDPTHAHIETIVAKVTKGDADFAYFPGLCVGNTVPKPGELTENTHRIGELFDENVELNQSGQMYIRSGIPDRQVSRRHESPGVRVAR